MLKRIAAFFLVLTFAFSMAGCTSALKFFKERLANIQEVIPTGKTPDVQPTELPLLDEMNALYNAAVPPDSFAAYEAMTSGAWEAHFKEEPEFPSYPEFNTDEYAYTKENSFRSVATSPLSTFAADVDTASYSNFRRQVLKGGKVNPDSGRGPRGRDDQLLPL